MLAILDPEQQEKEMISNLPLSTAVFASLMMSMARGMKEHWRALCCLSWTLIHVLSMVPDDCILLQRWRTNPMTTLLFRCRLRNTQREGASHLSKRFRLLSQESLLLGQVRRSPRICRGRVKRKD